VLSDSQGPISPGKDVRALFDKARIGDLRYVTFATQNTTAKSEVTLPPSEEAAAPEPIAVLPAGASVQHRRALNAVFEVNAGLRVTSSVPGWAAGSKTALTFASCAGGVGKTTLCATVARVLSSRLCNVLLADRCSDGIIPLYFSLERLSAGGLQTVYPNARRAGYQITLVVAPWSSEPNIPTATWLEQLQAESILTLMDLPTINVRSMPPAIGSDTQVIVPLVPDVSSIASIARAEELSTALAGEQGRRSLFVLNRFDEKRALHRDIRTHLEKILGDRLAPIAIRESEYVPEALSLGMTVLDHVPQSSIAQDFEQFVLWLEQRLSSPAASSAN
jgi:cellulose synthase operon protein YhjQ